MEYITDIRTVPDTVAVAIIYPDLHDMQTYGYAANCDLHYEVFNHVSVIYIYNGAVSPDNPLEMVIVTPYSKKPIFHPDEIAGMQISPVYLDADKLLSGDSNVVRHVNNTTHNKLFIIDMGMDEQMEASANIDATCEWLASFKL